MQTTIDIRSDNQEFLNKLHKLSMKHEINGVLGFTWHYDGESVTITQKCETDTKEHNNIGIALLIAGLLKDIDIDLNNEREQNNIINRFVINKSDIELNIEQHKVV